MSTRNRRRLDGLGAALLLGGTALVYIPLTAELLPQKAFVFALALPFALGRLGPGALAALCAGAVIAAVRPAAPWEVLALAGAPAAWELLRAAGEEAVGRIVRFATWALCALGLAQAAGIELFAGAQGAFNLSYPTLTATLGNPNHLAAWLVLATPLVSGPTLFLAIATTVLTRSGLAIAALVVHGLLRARAPWQRGLLAAALAVGAFTQTERLQARGELFAAHAQLLDARTLAVGLGPGAVRAAYLRVAPPDLGDPGHPHNDALRLVLTWGLPLPLVWLTRRRVRFRPRWSAWGPAIVLAMGHTVIGDPAAWALLLVHFARDATPTNEAPPPRLGSEIAAPLLAGFVLLCGLWCAEGWAQRQVLEEVSQGRPAPQAALARVRDWPFDPVLSERIIGLASETAR